MCHLLHYTIDIPYPTKNLHEIQHVFPRFPMFPQLKLQQLGIRSVRIHMTSSGDGMSRQEDGDAAAAPVGVRNAASLNLTKAS